MTEANSTGITPSAKTHLTLFEIAANWARELPGQNEDEILRNLLTAYFEKQFARAYLIDNGELIEVDSDEILDSKGDFWGVTNAKLTDPSAYRKSDLSDIAEKVYLHGYAVARSDFMRWCNDCNETPPTFWPALRRLDTPRNLATPGRPTYRQEIEKAYKNLKENNSIDWASMKANERAIRKEANILAGRRSFVVDGMGYQAILLAVGDQFKRDRAKASPGCCKKL